MTEKEFQKKAKRVTGEKLIFLLAKLRGELEEIIISSIIEIMELSIERDKKRSKE